MSLLKHFKKKKQIKITNYDLFKNLQQFIYN